MICSFLFFVKAGMFMHAIMRLVFSVTPPADAERSSPQRTFVCQWQT